MTRQLPPDVDRVAAAVAKSAGSYLHNTVALTGVTCRVCRAPVDGYAMCAQCNKHAHAGLPLASLVGSVAYAVEYESQAYKLVQNYKASRSGPILEQTMRALLAVALRGHFGCAVALSQQSSHGWAVVPSTRGRSTLREMVAALSSGKFAEIEVAYTGSSADEARVLEPSFWSLASGSALPAHIVVIDDSWVSGAHAQSVAAMLRSAGAERVSILTIARILDPSWQPNAQFIRERIQGSFDPRTCPWTGADCPIP